MDVHRCDDQCPECRCCPHQRLTRCGCPRCSCTDRPTFISPTEARAAGLALIARVEAVARGDVEAAEALAPTSAAEALAAYNLAVMMLADVCQTGGHDWLDKVRRALLAADNEGDPQ